MYLLPLYERILVGSLRNIDSAIYRHRKNHVFRIAVLPGNGILSAGTNFTEFNEIVEMIDMAS